MLPPPSSLTDALDDALAEGRHQMGEVAIVEDDRGFVLCHVDDRDNLDGGLLEVFEGADAALDIVRLDDKGAYRPLRTAPTLRHGWQLQLGDLIALRLALDFLYPACLGTWLASTNAGLPVLDLRAKLERQTGMYRSARFASEAGLRDLVAHQCGPNCLKRVLWRIGKNEPAPVHEEPAEHEGEIPLYCFEACNLLVAGARTVSRREHRAKREA